MPTTLLWGDDVAALEEEIDARINAVVDPVWASLNVSRFDGSKLENTARALEEVRTPPLGGGYRVVLITRSPLCNGCTGELANRFKAALQLVPATSHLLLYNPARPDSRLCTTKLIRAQVKQDLAEERSFQLPAIWDIAGQQKLVKRAASELKLVLEPEAITALVNAVGTDSARLALELQKLDLYAGDCGQKRPITAAAVMGLVDCRRTNVLQVSDALLADDIGDAITLIDTLLDAGEPALRIVAILSSQIRSWLWVSLLGEQGKCSVEEIAKAACIANPKRIYLIRKQIQNHYPEQFSVLLGQMLEIEAALKRGSQPGDAFRDGLLG